MKVSEVIKKLEEIKAEEGDINVCMSEDHEYWGTTSFILKEWDIKVSDHAQPNGPKQESERAVIIGK